MGEANCSPAASQANPSGVCIAAVRQLGVLVEFFVPSWVIEKSSVHFEKKVFLERKQDFAKTLLLKVFNYFAMKDACCL